MHVCVVGMCVVHVCSCVFMLYVYKQCMCTYIHTYACINTIAHACRYTSTCTCTQNVQWCSPKERENAIMHILDNIS